MEKIYSAEIIWEIGANNLHKAAGMLINGRRMSFEEFQNYSLAHRATYGDISTLSQEIEILKLKAYAAFTEESRLEALQNIYIIMMILIKRKHC